MKSEEELREALSNEIGELNEKLRKLEKFINGEHRKDISFNELQLLRLQALIMESYVRVLNLREDLHPREDMKA